MVNVTTMHNQIAAKHRPSHIKAIKGTNVAARISNSGTQFA
jgi:hypothetical protein